MSKIIYSVILTVPMTPVTNGKRMFLNSNLTGLLLDCIISFNIKLTLRYFTVQLRVH